MFRLVTALRALLSSSNVANSARPSVHRTRLNLEPLENRLVTTTTPIANPLTDSLARATVRIESWWDINGDGKRQDPILNSQGKWTGGDYLETGSGAMITPNDVLTAGHMVYQNNFYESPAQGRGKADWVYVYPAQNGSARPFGRAAAIGKYTPKAWRLDDLNCDMGILRLDRNVGWYTGHMHFGWLDPSFFNPAKQLSITVRHYPGDLGDGSGTRQYLSTGVVDGIYSWMRQGAGYRKVVGDQVISYDPNQVETTAGSSGGPVIVQDIDLNNGTWGNVPTIIGVHVREFPGTTGLSSEATRITPYLFNWIESTINSGVTMVDRADLMDYDQWTGGNTSRIVTQSGTGVVHPGDRLRIDASIWNGGTARPGADLRVRFYLWIKSTVGTDKGIKLGTVTYPLSSPTVQQLSPYSSQPAIATWVGVIPSTVQPGTKYYIGWQIDPGMSLQDYDRSNNFGVFQGGMILVQ